MTETVAKKGEVSESNIIQAKKFFNTQICKADIEVAIRGIVVAILGLSNLQVDGIVFANS